MCDRTAAGSDMRAEYKCRAITGLLAHTWSTVYMELVQATQRWTDEPQYFPVCLSIADSKSALAFMVQIPFSSFANSVALSLDSIYYKMNIITQHYLCFFSQILNIA